MPLSSTGYNKKTFEDVVEAIKQAIWSSTFGPGANLEPESAFGQLTLIVGKVAADIYEDVEDTYNWQSPSNASGVPLSNIGEATNSFKKPATKGTGTITVFGTLGTSITAGDLIVSVDGNSDSRFVTTEDAEIAAGTNEVQTITFSATPDTGQWALSFEGESTSVMAYNANNATIEANLEALSSLSSVSVSGSYASGIVVTYTGADGSQPQELLRYTTNTLEASSVAVSIQIAETTAGVLPNVEIAIEAVNAGNIPAYAGTLTVIETPLSGVDSCTNAADITQGTDIETDAEFRLSRVSRLANPGKGTVDSIYAHLIALADVDDARVYENDTDTTDGFGRPPSSLHAVVLGGADQDIIDIIGADKPAGTRTYGDQNGTYVNEQGQNILLHFDRPTTKPIYINITVTVDADSFPVDGDTAIKQALVDYGDANFKIGKDVLFHKLYKPIEDIVGIISIEMFIGFTDPATTDVNLTIADDEISFFDTSTIDVTVV